MARKLRDEKHAVFTLTKDSIGQLDLSQFQTVYLIAGRARPNYVDTLAELDLVRRAISSPRPPERLVYVSSLAVEREPTPYAQLKLACEKLITDREFGRVVRPPVIFGPTQSPLAEMLIPAIARAKKLGQPLRLKQPTKPFDLMHVDDVCHAMYLMGRFGDDTKILSLYSDPIDPLEVIEIAAPGLPFEVLRGWSHDTDMPIRPVHRPGHVALKWHVRRGQISETVDHMANVLDQL